jgi:hypothetical protein
LLAVGSLPLLILLTLAVLPAYGGQGAAGAEPARARLVAALERLMLTGEPLHTSHDDGARLQEAVDRAFASGDAEIQRLAQRAATPLVSYLDRPVAPSGGTPSIGVRRPEILKLPREVTSRAQILASFDGGEMFDAGQAPPPGGGLNISPPDRARMPGLHHVRLQAHIVYKGAGSVPPPEIRNLQELTYAIYDSERDDQFDARVFIQSPAGVRANRFSDKLPDELFAHWLNAELARHATKPEKVDWLPHYCDDRTVETGARPQMRDICSVAYFGVKGIIGQIWFRTGRVELTDAEVKWMAEPPTFQALKLLRDWHTEFDDLGALPALLTTDPSQWPRADVSVAPEDVTISRAGSNLSISAIVRNSGLVGVRGVEVSIDATIHGERGGPQRTFVVEVPAGGSVELKTHLPFAAPYGSVVVFAKQASNHAPFESWHFDPTPEDAITFRVVSPERAPKGYEAGLRAQCGYPCRGF